MAMVSIPVLGKFKLTFDSMEYNTCDGHRFLSQIEQCGMDFMLDRIKETLKPTMSILTNQLIGILAETGYWPLERAVLLIPRMYENEEKATKETRKNLIAFDIDRMESIVNEIKDLRPNEYKKYLTEDN